MSTENESEYPQCPQSLLELAAELEDKVGTKAVADIAESFRLGAARVFGRAIWQCFREAHERIAPAGTTQGDLANRLQVDRSRISRGINDGELALPLLLIGIKQLRIETLPPLPEETKLAVGGYLEALPKARRLIRSRGGEATEGVCDELGETDFFWLHQMFLHPDWSAALAIMRIHKDSPVGKEASNQLKRMIEEFHQGVLREIPEARPRDAELLETLQQQWTDAWALTISTVSYGWRVSQ